VNLTESALYSVALAHQGNGIVFSLATKHVESQHGADWERWIVREHHWLGFRVQAKRLFRRGRYSSLFKSGTEPESSSALLWRLDGRVSQERNEDNLYKIVH
jgi:hypothetical protein